LTPAEFWALHLDEFLVMRRYLDEYAKALKKGHG